MRRDGGVCGRVRTRGVWMAWRGVAALLMVDVCVCVCVRATVSLSLKRCAEEEQEGA